MKFPWPKEFLMITPHGYRVEYAINPHMLDAAGALQKVDTVKARQQWERLKRMFEKLGIRVDVLEGHPELPDMTFCANQVFPMRLGGDKKAVVLGKMASAQRQPEVSLVKAWAEKRGYTIIPDFGMKFEGCGDALWNYETGEIVGGHGFRTDPKAYSLLRELTSAPIHPVELVNPHYYHLDTCLAILNGATAAFVGEAFSEESLTTLRKCFPRLIEISPQEATQCFAANCVSVNGIDVVLHQGADQFKRDLEHYGFRPHEVDTSEFIKAGGSAFCMKQALF